jgi:NADH:ubiquinone oxidoreductase subunit 4 (subunit M)
MAEVGLSMTYWLAGLFLPLFPLSMGFNALLGRVRKGLFRPVLLLAWPQLGLSLAFAASNEVPDWVLVVALFTAALYAFRAIALREVGQWIGFLATSAWALLWPVLMNGAEVSLVRMYALGFSVPLALLALLGARLERDFGAAYTGLYGGLGEMLPRFSGVLVFVVLAVTAMPVFPGFFALFTTVVEATATAPSVALSLVVIWLLWSWAGVRLLQGLIVGPANDRKAPDLSAAALWTYASAIVVLLISGLYVAGELL